MARLKDFWIENRKLILITFEVFWIAVFLLDNMAGNNGVEVPEFIYVNF